jgi:hypothetical protein
LTTGSKTFTSGTPTNPTIIAFKDFQGGTSTLSMGAHDIIFVGCRFSMNTPSNSSAANIVNLGSAAYNVQFVYCTFAPLTSFGYSGPTGAAWPSAGAGQQTITQNSGNSVNGSQGYQFGLGAYGTNTNGSFMVQCDHCDSWGFGNGFLDTHSTQGQINILDCWVHDACASSPIGYHQDGLGYLDGAGAPGNILIQHCTVASIGNTNAIAFQAASSGYKNIHVINNYFSGYGYCVDMCHSAAGSTGLIFTDNVFGTDLPWKWGPVYPGSTTLFNGTGNTWRRNKLQVLPGTSPWSGTVNWTAANNGNFVLPGNSFSANDWAN